MIPKQIPLAALLVSGLLLAPAAEAVTIDLSSPQEGTTVYPGDTVELAMTLTNDTDEADMVRVDFTLTVEIPEQPPLSYAASLRYALEAGETINEELGLEIAEDLPIPGLTTATIEAVAVGLDSGTEDSDSLFINVAPLPGGEDKGRDEGVSIDLSSPQEGTTVYPGDTVEMTAAVSNNTGMQELIYVTFSMTVEIPDDPIVVEGQFPMVLEDGETVEESLVVEIPAELPLEGPVSVTIEATAVGSESGSEDSDSLSLTVAPLGGKQSSGGTANTKRMIINNVNKTGPRMLTRAP